MGSVGLPESNGLTDPSLCWRAEPGAKTVSNAWHDAEFDSGAQLSQPVHPPLHGGWRRNAVAFPHDDIGWWLCLADVGVAGIGHDHRRWPGKVLATKRADAVGS